VNASVRNQLYHRVSQARSNAEQTVADARATTEAVRSTQVSAQTARKRRWTIRYERAFMKNSGLLSELDRPGD
jgi:hypothetical protein